MHNVEITTNAGVGLYRFIDIAEHDTGDPVDITGWTARWGVKNELADVARVFEATTGNGKLVIDPDVTGRLHFAVSAVDIASIGIGDGSWVHRLQLIEPGGAITELMGGKLIITAGMWP